MEPIAVCTVITKNYLAHARVLAHSLVAHNPGSKLYVLVADSPDGYFKPNAEPFETLFLQDLQHPEAVADMCFYYGALELCCALRAALHEYMQRKTSHSRWALIDPDVLICSSLQPAWESMKDHSVLLTPHALSPCEDNGQYLLERTFLGHGIYNGGFVGVTRCPESGEFIAWFQKRLMNHCFSAPSSNQFVEQLWLNLVPLFFPKTGVLKHPGVNVARWNLHERALVEVSPGRFLSNGEPLIFFHFSGFDPMVPGKLSRYSNQLTTDPPALARLTEIYRSKLFENGYPETIRYPYTFSRFSTGEPVTSTMRHVYNYELMIGKRHFHGSPFDNAPYFRSTTSPLRSMARSVRNWARRARQRPAEGRL